MRLSIKKLTLTAIIAVSCSLISGCDKGSPEVGLIIGDSIVAKIFKLSAKTPEEVGKIEFVENKYGLLIKTDLNGLPLGAHGFHIHVNPDCGSGTKDGELVLGLAAGGHLDPHNSNQHSGPYSDSGHLGDLPALHVHKDGKANLELLAPKLKLNDIKKHSVMIHAGGDNYSDHPDALGGGGARLYCGVIE